MTIRGAAFFVVIILVVFFGGEKLSHFLQLSSHLVTFGRKLVDKLLGSFLLQIVGIKITERY